MKLSKNQYGIATVLPMLLVLVIVVAGAGLYIKNASDKTDKAQTNASNALDNEAAIKKSKSTAKTDTTSSKITSKQTTEVGSLVIKEWNVTLPLYHENADTVYDVSTTDKNIIYLSSEKFVKISDNCAPLKVSLMAIGRATKGTYQANLAKNKQTGPTIDNLKPEVTVGDYEYSLDSGQASCFKTPEDTSKYNQAVVDYKTAMTDSVPLLKVTK